MSDQAGKSIKHTRPIYTKTVATKGKDLTTSGINGRLWEVPLLANVFDKFYRHLLYQLENGFPKSMALASVLSFFVADFIPLLRLL